MRRVAYLAGALLVVICSVALLGLAQGHIDPHDGSCIAVLARNLASSGRYGYAKYGVFELWPVEATTGPTLVLPIAIAYRLVGTGPFVANLTVALVVLVLIALLWWQMMPRFASLWAVASGLLAIGIMVGIMLVPAVALVVPRGEVVAGLLLVLATTVALGREQPSRARAAASGLLLGLGVASKVLLLLPGAALFLALLVVAWRTLGTRRALQVAAIWIAVVLAVQLVVEAWKLASFGAWQPYADRWREFIAFFRVAGSGLRSGSGLLAERRTLAYRLNVLDENLGYVPLAFAAALVVLPVLVGLPALLGRPPRADRYRVDARLALALAAEAVAVTLWWLFRADIPWLRYLFFACITAPLCVHYAVLAAGRWAHGSALALAVWIVVLSAALLATAAGRPQWQATSERSAARAAAVLDAARALREIAAADPQATFWSAGWWQHWDVQSVQPLQLHDLFGASALATLRDGHDYLVTSDYFNWEQDPRLLSLLDAHRRLVAYRNAYFTIYRLHPTPTRKVLREAGRDGSAAPWRVPATVD